MSFLLWVLMLGVMILPANVQAYIDPGSGSLVLQVLIGGAVGLLVAVKLGWRWLVSLLLAKKKPGKFNKNT